MRACRLVVPDVPPRNRALMARFLFSSPRENLS